MDCSWVVSQIALIAIRTMDCFAGEVQMIYIPLQLSLTAQLDTLTMDYLVEEVLMTYIDLLLLLTAHLDTLTSGFGFPWGRTLIMPLLN